MRAVLVMLGLVLLLPSMASARPHPHLTPEAAALLEKPGLFLVPDDNLAVPLTGGKPVAFLNPAPAHLELAAPNDASPLLLVDDELYRVRAGQLARVGTRVGAMPAATPDFSLVAGIDEKKSLKLTRDGVSKIVPYHRDGRWELEHPYLTPDGATVLVALRDYTQPLDAYEFLVVDTKSGGLEEIKLSKSFVPVRCASRCRRRRCCCRCSRRSPTTRASPS